MKLTRYSFLPPLLAACLLGVTVAPPVRAGGVVSTCDEASLNTALSGGGAVTFSCSGTITLTSTQTIAADTMIDGSGQSVTLSGGNAIRLFTVNNGVSFTIKNMTLANGRHQATQSGTGQGGAIFNNGSLTLNAVTLSGNRALGAAGAAGAQGTPGQGGAIYHFGTALAIAQSNFTSNSALGGSGGAGMGTPAGAGGLAFGGAIFSKAPGVTISDSTFTGNVATAGDAGPVNAPFYNAAGGIGAGGAIANVVASAPSISRSTFNGNSATGGRGSNDSAGGGGTGGYGLGGALYGNFNANSSTLTGNGAAGGPGGLDNFGAPSGAGGEAYGGGYAAEYGFGTLTGCTVAGNLVTGGTGGTTGVAIGGNLSRGTYTMTPVNTLVSAGGAGGNCNTPPGDGGYNLSSDGSCGFTAGGSLNNANPLLSALADNGGPTWTMALNSGSPAINAGNGSACSITEQRYATRSGICDIGAYEYGGVLPSTPTISGFSPTHAPLGASVVITGTDLASAQSVTFNGAAASFTANSSTQITATVPAAATYGFIRVTNPAGTATSATAFEVDPTITGFTPGAGPTGTIVTINGTRFTGAISVAFNGTGASFTVISDSQITATVPAGASSGLIRVANGAGGFALSAANFYTGGVVNVCDEAAFNEALAEANNVTFTCSGTITLTATRTIAADTSLDATGHLVTLSGGNSIRHFIVNSGITFTIRALTIANGRKVGATIWWAPGESVCGGAILNNGTLNLYDSAFVSNQIIGGGTVCSMSTCYGGGSGRGGAICNAAMLNAINTSFSSNTATGGMGGTSSNDVRGQAGGGGYGGAIYSSGSETLTDSIFLNNATIGGAGGYNLGVGGDGQGGAIAHTAGTAQFTRITFTANSATGGNGGRSYSTGPGSAGSGAGVGGNADGGALYVSGGTVSASTLHWISNLSRGGDGGTGAGSCGGGSNVTPGANGGSGQGGGLHIAGGSFTLFVGDFTANSSTGGIGGSGGYSCTGCNPRAAPSTGGPGHGGAAFFSGSGTHRLSSVNFAGNQASGGRGGAFSAPGGTGGPGRGGVIYTVAAGLDLTNTLFTGNQSSGGNGGDPGNGSCCCTFPNPAGIGRDGGNGGIGQGGAVYNDGTPVGLVNATFATDATSGGLGGPGGGGFNGGAAGNPGAAGTGTAGGFGNNAGNPVLQNAILWNNSDSSGTTANAQITVIAGAPSLFYSDVMGGWGGAGSGNVNVDPQFVNPLGPDGIPGTTDDDLHLASTSPVCDAGINAAVPAGVTTDLSGGARFVDNPGIIDTGFGSPPIVDMGAYEWSLDSDGDGIGNGSDCAPNDATAWVIPTEARNLRLSGPSVTSLTWSAPAAPGGTQTRYDVLRSTTAANFVNPANTVCAATNISASSSLDNPGAISVFYLVRARNGCGGTLGQNSGGIPISGRSCP